MTIADTRIKNIVETTSYPNAVSHLGKMIVDWEGLPEAISIPVSAFGNCRIQGSFDDRTYSDTILPTHNYLRFSSDGGTTWLPINIGTVDDVAKTNVANIFTIGQIIQVSTDGADILSFTTESPWKFKQSGTVSSSLVLQAQTDNRSFKILSQDGSKSVNFGMVNTGSTLSVDGNLVYHEGNLNSGTDLALNNLTLHGTVGSPTFVSGFTGSGWRLENGHLTVDNLTVREQMRVYELILNQVKNSNGAIAVTDGAKIKSVTETSTYWECVIETIDGTMAAPFAVNDIVFCKSWNSGNTKDYKGLVTTVSGDTFRIDKATFNNPSSAPATGDIINRWGNTTDTNRQGLIYITSSDDNSPYIDILDGISSMNPTDHVKARIGDLSGILSPTWGQLSGIGVYIAKGWFEDVNISGNLKIKAGGDVGGWDITDTAMVGQNITISSLGFIGSKINDLDKWKLNSDGSGLLASGNLSWDADGNLMIKTSMTINGGTVGGMTVDDNNLIANNIEFSSQGYIRAFGPTSIGITEDPDFTTWDTANAQTIVSSDDQFTTTMAGGVLKINSLVNGMTYYVHVEGSTTASSITLTNGNESFVFMPAQTGAFNYTNELVYNNTTSTSFYLKVASAGTTTINSIVITQKDYNTVVQTWKLNSTGSGMLAAGNISWDEIGNVDITGKITTDEITVTGGAITAAEIGGFTIANGNIINNGKTGKFAIKSADEKQQVSFDVGYWLEISPYNLNTIGYFKNTAASSSGNTYVGIYAKAANAGSGGAFAGYFDGRVYCHEGYIGDKLWDINRGDVVYLDSDADAGIPAGSIVLLSGKTVTRTYTLPDVTSSSVKASKPIRICNYNDADCFIYPYGTQQINGYSGSTKHIEFHTPTDWIELLPNSNKTGWIIIASGGDDINF